MTLQMYSNIKILLTLTQMESESLKMNDYTSSSKEIKFQYTM